MPKSDGRFYHSTSESAAAIGAGEYAMIDRIIVLDARVAELEQVLSLIMRDPRGSGIDPEHRRLAYASLDRRQEATMFLSEGVEFAISYLKVSVGEANALREEARKIEAEKMEAAVARGRIAGPTAPVPYFAKSGFTPSGE